mmetsp:Transcript_70952/g.125447  ORF Transcript_70952/g.125447 Transcript_70952/m.125447 type:complete len:726 (-) Transcript_70952:227-2404(-)|eukprot:CAMPEP_0197654232 /NCGR_PEP_ID=MMETSP1338-20131121/38725_1 /TAXON_ID=43686 ORGANISM="Pelagodinium beii, Strain RCC1491" /NCGR_SAMPLE_ID=MMETSP1338 /ASSEMBLY_ACC=CAM_ASM_000754 /LENGTH=725 /DNA_ID=CAMNT_0043229637 /DNA_START=92 /DNA_END=2269 /DNA_ORIENTATION=-
MTAIQIKLTCGDESSSICMIDGEMEHLNAQAFDAIRQTAEGLLAGKALKRVTYLDDEGDFCTLSAPSIPDALKFVENGILELKVESEGFIFKPEARAVPESTSESSEPVQDPVVVKHSSMPAQIEAKEMAEGVVAWTDRRYVYQNVPSKLIGSTLFSSPHRISGNGGGFTVEAPEGSVCYIFSETHRDGGFPNLGWTKVEAGRFEWVQEKGKTWGLNLWMKVHEGKPLYIPTTDCLVGGVTIQLQQATETSADTQADNLTDVLMAVLKERTAGADIRKVLPKLAEEGLRLIDEMPDPDLFFPLIDPFLSMKDSTMDLDNLPVYAEMALVAFHAAPGDVQAQLLERLGAVLTAAVEELKATSSPVEVHPTVVCDGCDMHPIVGKRFKCAMRPDYDLCEKCHAEYEKLHPGQGKWNIVAGQAADVVGFNCTGHGVVECDGCDKAPLCPTEFKVPASSMPSSSETIEQPAEAAICECNANAAENSTTQITAVRKESEESQHFFIGEPSVSANALAMLLEHPDEVVRSAAKEALHKASAPEASDDEWEKPSQKEESQDGEEWEKMDDLDIAEQPEGVQEKSARAIYANVELSHLEASADFAEARGDVTNEFGHLLANYPKLKQAYRLGRIAVQHTQQDATANVKTIITNNGSKAWPAASSLRLVAGPDLGFPELALGPVPSGETVEICMDLKLGSSDAAGSTSLTAWAMVDEAAGEPFGPLLVLELGRV